MTARPASPSAAAQASVPPATRAMAAPGWRVTILLATCNGAAHLREQLDSYRAQEETRWDLWVSDDGSTDGTRAIVEAFRAECQGQHEIRLIDGPRRGPAANFMFLLTHPDLPIGPVALSDQDDVWLPDKLTLARAGLAQHAGPVLYGARSIHTDPELSEIGRARLPRHPPSFCNALTQNIVSGHSTVLNAAALALVRQAGPPRGIPYHDWWLYQLVTGAGGTVVIDPACVLYYRQHAANVMGAHRGLPASLRRAAKVMGRSYGRWIEANTEALARIAPLLTPENRQLLEAFRSLPVRGGLRRAWGFHRLGLHRQGRLSTTSLLLAAGLGRV